jgi:hypothetical protein
MIASIYCHVSKLRICHAMRRQGRTRKLYALRAFAIYLARLLLLCARLPTQLFISSCSTQKIRHHCPKRSLNYSILLVLSAFQIPLHILQCIGTSKVQPHPIILAQDLIRITIWTLVVWKDNVWARDDDLQGSFTVWTWENFCCMPSPCIYKILNCSLPRPFHNHTLSALFQSRMFEYYMSISCSLHQIESETSYAAVFPKFAPTGFMLLGVRYSCFNSFHNPKRSMLLLHGTLWKIRNSVSVSICS